MTERTRVVPAHWTIAQDLIAQLSRLWERGELLRSLLENGTVFPLRLSLKGPTSTELTERFEGVRAWIANLATVEKIRIEWREFSHRILGPQRLPQTAWVENLDDALAIIGKRGEAARFADLLARTRSRQPNLIAWLRKRPLQALELASDWDRFLDVVEWLVRHPRPGIYLRQVDIPGVHSKFIEKHRSLLAEWFDVSLPAAAIDTDRVGIDQFAARYGFLNKPVRIRFRLLDPQLTLLPGPILPDIALDADSFAKMVSSIRQVYITENETNFLAFPNAPQAIVIFGGGYGWDALSKALWLTHCSLHYWGDIDTHGFAILDRLRSRLSHVQSFLMDRATLMAHETLWGEEHDQTTNDLPTLTRAEAALYDDLRDNRIRKNLRLEQERVGFHHVKEALGLDRAPKATGGHFPVKRTVTGPD
jgi:hypothetical protein